MARDELTTIGASARQPAFTVAAASPPCAPMPGMSSGSFGADAPHGLHFRGIGRAHHEAELAVHVPGALRQICEVLIKQWLTGDRREPLVLQVVAAGVRRSAQQECAFAVVLQVRLQ
jgi:hypothetical protein